MKRALVLVAGICWLIFSVGFAFILFQYVTQGAGLQFYPMFSSGSVLVGLVHVIGLSVASLVCFAIGCGLCAHGLVRKQGPGL